MGMVVYSVEKYKFLIELISKKDQDFLLKLSRTSLKLIRIHIWLIPLILRGNFFEENTYISQNNNPLNVRFFM